MSQGGYTLSEMLIALIVISLTSVGLITGVDMIGRSAKRFTAGLSSIRTQDALTREWSVVLDGRQLMGGKTGLGFIGDARGFRFDCNLPLACGVSLAQSGGVTEVRFGLGAQGERYLSAGRLAHPRFIYGDGDSASDVWPNPNEPKRPLKWLALVDGVQPVLSSRFRVELAPGCKFDAIARECRGGA